MKKYKLEEFRGYKVTPDKVRQGDYLVHGFNKPIDRIEKNDEGHYVFYSEEDTYGKNFGNIEMYVSDEPIYVNRLSLKSVLRKL